MLIADEVQGGIARTGKMFSIEHSGVVPDLITVAKGLGGGFPLSGVTGRATIMDAAHPGGLGGTYGGNPISIAAAHAVLDVIEAEGLCARAARVGQQMQSRLQSAGQGTCRASATCAASARWWPSSWSRIRRPRNRMPALTASILAHAEKRGLILLSCGTEANVVRLLAPLTIPDAVLEEGLEHPRRGASRMRCGVESARAVA